MSQSSAAGTGLGAVVRTIETRTAIYALHDDGVIVQRLRDKAKQTMADAKENVAAFGQLCNGQKRGCLVDGRAALTADPGVREYYAGPELSKNASAAALLAGSSTMKVIANLFLTINKPVMPTRMFTDEQEALDWLRRIDMLLRQTGK